MANETEFKFGDYAIIEQKRHGVPSEMFVHKVIGIRRSNSWVDVPVQSPATETLHCGMEVVCLCICCGIDETKVRQYRVKDMQRSSRSPDSELTAALATIEKCREIVGSPAGLDLQDHLRLLAAENVGMRETIDAVRGVADNSSGIAGWHLNGDIAKWSEILPEIDAIETPATDRIYAAQRSAFVDEAVAKITESGALTFGDCLVALCQLREVTK
ncbi:hypothetical protein PVK56_14765 [Raoultella ornithinolytica]|uniref:hypothetical protein n=1 Tax=Raoultella ornithinolytica TaxID=54291 RepID=UPI0037479174